MQDVTWPGMVQFGSNSMRTPTLNSYLGGHVI